MADFDDLKDRLKNIIYEDVPINNICPHCGNEIEMDCLIDLYSKIDKRAWDNMVANVIKAVVDYIEIGRAHV